MIVFEYQDDGVAFPPCRAVRKTVLVPFLQLWSLSATKRPWRAFEVNGSMLRLHEKIYHSRSIQNERLPIKCECYTILL